MHYIWVEGQCQKWSLAAVTAAHEQMILDATKSSIVVTIIIRLSTIINVSDHDRGCSGSDQGRRTTRPCLPARLTTRLSRWTTNMLTPSLINQPTSTNWHQPSNQPISTKMIIFDHQRPLRAPILLSILFPPQKPEITGYIQGETIRYLIPGS